MQQGSENAQRQHHGGAERSGSSAINEQIENALSLLASNPAVSAEVVRTIRDIYTSHTQSGAPVGLQNCSPSEEEAAGEQALPASQRQEAKLDAESAGEHSSEEESSAAAGPAAGGGSIDSGKRLHLTEEQVIEI